jgi:protocatechuate 3,4-dioxygenase, beta subunit
MIRPLILTVLLAAFTGTATHALDVTPPQIEGPYYPKRKPAEADSDLTRIGNGAQAQGEVLVINGTVTDPEGKPIAGARVEIWQTDHKGIYLHPRDPGTAKRDQAFQSYGEAVAGDTGTVSFRTIMPGAYAGRPRHLHVKVTPPGGKTLTTQLYFAGDAGLDKDAIAFELGRKLEQVLLAPKRTAGEGSPLEASVRLVVVRGRPG